MSRWMLLVLVPFAGCRPTDILYGGAPMRTSAWMETGEVRKPLAEIARTVQELLLRQGYPPVEFDSSQRLETDWDVHLSPRIREGYRTKIEAEIVSTGTGGFNVRVRSTLEVNNADYSSTAERADWIGAAASEKHKAHISDEAMKLNSLLKNRFFGLNP